MWLPPCQTQKPAHYCCSRPQRSTLSNNFISCYETLIMRLCPYALLFCLSTSGRTSFTSSRWVGKHRHKANVKWWKLDLCCYYPSYITERWEELPVKSLTKIKLEATANTVNWIGFTSHTIRSGHIPNREHQLTRPCTAQNNMLINLFICF